MATFSGNKTSRRCARVMMMMMMLFIILIGGFVDEIASEPIRGFGFHDRPCDDMYVVGEGETLHSIAEKCDDPFIVERNPHIQDPDDVFPGLIISISPNFY